eukprot:5616411-Pyramimonas_sp.AAC.1
MAAFHGSWESLLQPITCGSRTKDHTQHKTQTNPTMRSPELSLVVTFPAPTSTAEVTCNILHRA